MSSFFRAKYHLPRTMVPSQVHTFVKAVFVCTPITYRSRWSAVFNGTETLARGASFARLKTDHFRSLATRRR